MKIKIKKPFIMIGVTIVSVFIIVLVIDGFYKCAKYNEAMELLYSALSERDIELLDELFDPECAVIADEVERKYSDQREYIEDILNTINFDVLSYEYFSLDASTNRFFNYSLYFFEMRITDADGTRYTLRTTPCVCRKGLFDFKIIRIKYFITPKPAC